MSQSFLKIVRGSPEAIENLVNEALLDIYKRGCKIAHTVFHTDKDTKEVTCYISFYASHS